jgi:hypothetical protein
MLLTSAINRSSFGSEFAVRGRTATRPSTVKLLRLSLIASRKSLFRRARRCAGPCRRERKTPYRKESAGCQMSVKKSVGNLRPFSSRCEISTRLLRLSERGRLFLPTNFSRQPFSPLGATPSQNFTAALGRHARPEAVVVQLLAIRRLECPFHYYSPITKLAEEYSRNVDFVKGINARKAALRA